MAIIHYFSEMPLTFQKQIDEATKIGVWHITEAEEFFLQCVPLQRSITHPHKRLQHLAGRYLLRELFPAFPLKLIEIANTRKPFLPNEAFHFSISHCGDFAAAIVSTESRVGVDIEIPHVKIEKIRHKFLSEKEQLLLNALKEDHDQMLTLAWSVKEAVFKWFGEGEVDFIDHIHIEKIDFVNEKIMVLCKFLKPPVSELQVQSRIIAGNNLSWIIA